MCRKSIAKLEIIRPKLEQSYEEAIKIELAEQEQAERLRREQILRKEESERLQKLKSGQEKLNSAKSSPEILLKSDTISTSPSIPATISASYYALPYPNNVQSSQIHADKDTNCTLKALQDKLGINDFKGNENEVSKDNPAVAPIPKFFSEGGSVLRPVHVPQCLISKFMQLAAKNTQNNLETCGVLAGKLQHNEFTITCLIIPKQVATSDTCAMINEEEIITAQDSLDVMSLGWIHVIQTF